MRVFNLEKSSLFFEGMSKSHPELVQNIEIVHENRDSLDVSYHNPKLFILGCERFYFQKNSTSSFHLFNITEL